MSANQGSRVILFDGVCNLCNASVQFVLKRDSKALFQFGSLQSNTGYHLLENYGLQHYSLRRPGLRSSGIRNAELLNPDVQKGPSSMVLLNGQKALTKSSAALTIVKYLDWPWPLLYGFIVVPKFLRDAVYDFIGKRRYRWFGKRNTCWIAPDIYKSRFLEYDNVEANNE